MSSAQLSPAEHNDRLLVVDDDATIRDMFCARLQHAGFEVATAKNGVEALEKVLREPFSLVITDLHMPRLDGWELLGRIRSDFRTRELPVIVTTADAELTDALRLARAGAWDYISKTEGLTALVHRAVMVLSVRWSADAILERGDGKDFDLSRAGIWWTLEQLGEKRKTGVLRAQGRQATFELTVRRGMPIDAYAQLASRSFSGIMALRLMLTATNLKGHFLAGDVQEPSSFRLDMPSVLGAVRSALSQLQDAELLDQIRSNELVVDPDLYPLFERVGSPRALEILRAVALDRVPFTELTSRLNADEEELRQTLVDLVRRGVLRTRIPQAQ